MKKIICLTLVFLFSFTFFIDAYAIEIKQIVPASDENYEKFEKYTERNLLNQNSILNDFGLYAEDPGSGALRVIPTNNWSSGYVYQDGSNSGILSSIADLGVTLVDSFSGKTVLVKASTMVYNVASNIFGIASSYVETQKPVNTVLYHSFSYYQKLGQVYIANNGWQTKIRLETRYWMKHEFASFQTKSGYTKTGTYDNPKPAIQDYYDTKLYGFTHFYNEQWILDITRGRYEGRLGEWNLTWTY